MGKHGRALALCSLLLKYHRSRLPGSDAVPHPGSFSKHHRNSSISPRLFVRVGAQLQMGWIFLPKYWPQESSWTIFLLALLAGISLR